MLNVPQFMSHLSGQVLHIVSISFYVYCVLLRYRNLFIFFFFFSFIVRMRHVPKMAKKLYFISHGLHINFRMIFFFEQVESIILELILFCSQRFRGY